MQEKKRLRYWVVFALLAVLFLTAAVLNIGIGNVRISVGEILRILFAGGGSVQERNIVMQIRLPRMLSAGILGGALAVSGFLLQTFFANPIAGPYILGISSGAKMTVALAMILVIGRTGRSSNLLLVLAAFAGSLAATGFIILISHYVRHMASLLAAGIMIGYICSALTDFLVTFADDANIVNLHGWSQGSFSGMDWGSTAASALIVGAAMLFTMLLCKPIGAFALGENYAQSMGVNVRRYRVILILLSSILSACVTAFAGPVSFIGIAVPFLMRGCLQTAKPQAVIPASFLGGAVFCLFSDLLARVMFAPTELNISTVTSLFGAPIVIYMLLYRRKGQR